MSIAIVLLFALEVAVVATGRSSLLSTPNSTTGNTTTPHEATFMFPLIKWCISWSRSNRTEIKATDIGCLCRLHVRPDLGAGFTWNHSSSWHCTSRTLVALQDTSFFNAMLIRYAHFESNLAFSLVVLGSPCLGPPRLDATVQVV